MEYLIGLKKWYNVNATNFYKRIPGGDIFEYEKLYCTWNIGNVHWTLVIVNFTENSIKYLDGKTTKRDRIYLLGYTLAWILAHEIIPHTYLMAYMDNW